MSISRNDWWRIGLLTLGIEYLKAEQQHKEMVAARDAYESEREARWAEQDAAWDKFHADMQERIKRTEAIEIK